MYYGQNNFMEDNHAIRLYSKRNKGGSGLKSFKEVYDETKTRMVCYMAAATDDWIRVA